MQNVISLIGSLQPYIIIGLAVLVLILLIMNMVIFTSLSRLEKRYRKNY